LRGGFLTGCRKSAIDMKIKILANAAFKGGTHLHYFPTFNDLVDKVEEVLLLFANKCRKVLSLFGFHRDLSVGLEKAA
jgi:hypothetical protein